MRNMADRASNIPNIDLEGLAEAVGRAVTDRLGRRRDTSPLLYLFVGVLWGAGLGWLAFANSAASLRAGLMAWADEARKRAPAALKEMTQRTGEAVHSGGDRIEHAGDDLEETAESIEAPPIA